MKRTAEEELSRFDFKIDLQITRVSIEGLQDWMKGRTRN